MDELKGKRVVIMATDGYEENELNSPRKALKEAGAIVYIVAPKAGTIKGWRDGDWHGTAQVDTIIADVRAKDFDALVLPGGVMNPDRLRTDGQAVGLVRAFLAAGKPVAAICHGPWLLAEADVVRGRKVTSYKSLRTDLENAGANWVDEEVVVDHGLITSRSPMDLPAFNAKLLEEMEEGIHQN